ncbi:diaminopimelate decarboxylase [Chengkuizengella axinellae]|uniref:Diaminopimelate decarboxylase n=1 Tax=Chengkuizengella axinellae TaxID=3064388 RepID=A0ABT9IZ13_9BACL|nr:diaminopimelate decarboxylase [Chengkuizengella sp. 2205SS18-9]MDP5274598.1 diaminopimelate decarboxylase [Chengkuizengella sp. 2205SS18-9]
MDQHVLEELCNQYGTPLYVYNQQKIETQYDKLKRSLPDEFEIFYSVKANPLLGICKLFHSLGSGIEVASMGELYVALQAGFNPDDIIFTSPGKTYKELQYAIHNNIYCINIESIDEAKMIQEIALKQSKTVNICIRINPDFNINGAGLVMSGIPTQFGIDQSAVEDVIKTINVSMSNLNIAGIHVFSGSQMLDANLIVKNMEQILKLAIEISEENFSLELDFIDLGGGFGIPYFNGEKELDLELLKIRLHEIWSKYKDKLKGTRIGVESGRFLMAESGVFLTKVLYVKENKGHKYVVCDGGSNHHSSSAFLGRFVRNNFPMHLLGKAGEEQEVVSVTGCLCTPTDVIGQRVKLSKAVNGDILVIEKSGAYGFTHSPTLFLSHLKPAEVLFHKDKIQVLRERGELEDVLNGQLIFA